MTEEEASMSDRVVEVHKAGVMEWLYRAKRLGPPMIQALGDWPGKGTIRNEEDEEADEADFADSMPFLLALPMVTGSDQDAGYQAGCVLMMCTHHADLQTRLVKVRVGDPIGKAILVALALQMDGQGRLHFDEQEPADVAELAAAVEIPVEQARAKLRELINAGWLVRDGDRCDEEGVLDPDYGPGGGLLNICVPPQLERLTAKGSV